MAGFGARVVGAMQLRAATFEDVEHDPGATGQAAGVVVLSQIAQAVGTYGFAAPKTVALAVVAGLIGWVIGAGVVLVVGTRLFPVKATEADMGQLLRTLGFAESAGLVGVLGLVPALSWVAVAVGSVWILVAMVVAVRQALDYTSTTRAIVVCIVAWILMLAIQVLAGLLGFGAQVAAA